MNRLPSIPDGKAQVSFDETARGASKVVLNIPTWLMGTDRFGAPTKITKFKRVQSSDSELVAKFIHAIDSGWFETDVNGNKFVDITNVTYFDNSFKTKDGAWINFSQLVTADIATVEGAH